MNREDKYLLGCMFAINKFIEKGSSSCALKINGKWEMVSWLEIQEWIAKQYTELAETESPKWIPVSEKLPLLKYLGRISDDVLITNGYEVDMGYLVEREGKIFWHYYSSAFEIGINDKNNDVTAWMSLPKPYKTSLIETESEG